MLKNMNFILILELGDICVRKKDEDISSAVLLIGSNDSVPVQYIETYTYGHKLYIHVYTWSLRLSNT